MHCAVPASPGDGWDVDAQQASGFDLQKLCKILANASSGEANIHGIIIERHGRLVFELYRKAPDLPINVMFGIWHPFAKDVDFGPETLHDIRSISKSMIGLLFGIAKQKGYIRSLSTPVLEFYPEFSSLRSSPRDSIHLDHLLSMSSGFDWDEFALPNDETRLYWDRTPHRFVLSHPIIHEPGKVFHYNSGGTALLADILVRVTGKSLDEQIRTELFAPLGITSWEWVRDYRDRELAFTGLRMRPRDLTKICRLLLNGGRWRDEEIVPGDWIKESLRAHIATGLRSPKTDDEDLKYGYQWWTGRTEWRGKKIDWSAGFGNGGQRLFVAPALDMTVVVTAGEYNSSQINHVVNQLFKDIVSTVID